MSTHEEIVDEIPHFVGAGARSKTVHIPIYDDPDMGNDPVCPRGKHSESTFKRWDSSSYPKGSKKICDRCLRWWEVNDGNDHPRIIPRDYEVLKVAHRAGYFDHDKDVTIRDVANICGIEYSTANKGIRRALKPLVECELNR